jgi:hypothetical protein
MRLTAAQTGINIFTWVGNCRRLLHLPFAVPFALASPSIASPFASFSVPLSFQPEYSPASPVFLHHHPPSSLFFLLLPISTITNITQQWFNNIVILKLT